LKYPSHFTLIESELRHQSLELDLLGGVHHIELRIGTRSDSILSIVVHPDSFASPLRRDNDHAVRTTRSVKRGRSGVLKNVDRFNIIWIQCCKITGRNWHAVHNVKR